MRQYEVTFIVDPVLSGDEIKSTAKTYEDMLSTEGSKIVHVGEMGLKQLTYPLNKRNSGIYYTIEFSNDSGTLIPKLELALQRDERIMRFLTVKLDKYGVKYNDDKRNGLIGVAKKPEPKKDNRRGDHRSRKPRPPVGRSNESKSSEASPKEPSIAKAPAVKEPSIAKAPAVKEPSVAKAPTVEESSIAKAPAVKEPSIAKAPAVEESSIAKAPAVEEPSIAKAPAVEESSIAKAPPVNNKEEE